MTTTHASTQAPKPAEAASKPAQPGGNPRANADKPAEDLFASLLSLVSDTHQTAATNTLPDGEAANDAQAETDDPTEDNPLAALLAWGLPGTTASATGTGAAATASPGKAEGTAREGGIDVSGMTRVDEAAPTLPHPAAQARAAAASRPAFSPLNPNAAAATAAQRAGESNALPGGAPAMVWQRGAVSSTDALQQQQSAQFAQVRATVALNERLGVASAGTEVGAGPTSPREFALSGPAASATATGPAQDGSLTAAGGTAPGDSSGSNDPSSQSFTDPSNGDGRQPADARADAEAPTVSHWGTQHMRHASLRVGGEGADAIDIQLAVKGQEVQVAFQTDNAEARATLRESAGESLADLLQRSGIQLGGVSVGSQGQAQGDGSSYQPRPAGLSTEALGRASQAAEPAARPAMAPRTDGSRPLDVFA
ncbi:MAG: flagellar hook-length control protein FliK [Hydrogenophaga sp.]|uniref:flagellar hook-length control protein FliK n=1 Tax=Hydrogenophaga sp. TaxID=1904254 RepID=UPI0025C50B0F|nr:flagellar hook-length control protein FliK [Hydrogenophaga sp.]MBU7572930.1 flagellar hook-length control protein FliK [Hydrogenophaga sp.]